MHLSCLVSSCLVLSCLLLSCLVLRDSGRMFRVSLLRCLVCLARSLYALSVVCCLCCVVFCVCVCVCARLFGSVSLFGCVVGLFVWVCLGLCVLGGGGRGVL